MMLIAAFIAGFFLALGSAVLLAWCASGDVEGR